MNNAKTPTRCRLCDTPTNPRGLFTCLDPTVPAPACFACLFIHTLKGLSCFYCNGPTCVGFVAVATQQNAVVPVPVCTVCIVVKCDGSEIEVLPDTNRQLINESSDFKV